MERLVSHGWTFPSLVGSNQILGDYSQDVIEISLQQTDGCAAWKRTDSVADENAYFRIC